MWIPVFSVTTRYEGNAAIVSLSGELDLAGERELEEALAQARAVRRSLTIDLSELDFIDSSGLGARAAAKHRAARASSTP